MVSSLTGYADEISSFHIQILKFGKKCDKFGGNSENSWTPQGSWGLINPTPDTLHTWWRQVPSRVMVRIVKGKSRTA